MRVRATLASGIADAVRRAPRWSAGLLSWVVGGLLFLAHERRVALENLARVFPAWSRIRRWRVALTSYRATALALIEFLHTPKYSDREIRERFRLENVEALADAHASGEGVLLLSGHYGNWEWLGRRVALEGYPFAALFKEPKDPDLNERLRRARDAAGVRAFEHDDVRSAMRWLRGGNTLGILMDLEPRRAEDGVVVPLLGVPTRTFVGPFGLARRTGATVLTVFGRRVGAGRYRARFEPFRLSDAPDPDRAAVEDAAAFNARLEAAVRAAPDHWVWTYRRWKRIARPGGEATVGAAEEPSETGPGG